LSVFILRLLENFLRLGGPLLSGIEESDGSSTGQEIEDEHDDGKNQEDMNPSAKRVAADESYDPEEEENNCDCPKHFWFS
jgi:hypothetical protein